MPSQEVYPKMQMYWNTDMLRLLNVSLVTSIAVVNHDRMIELIGLGIEHAEQQSPSPTKK